MTPSARVAQGLLHPAARHVTLALLSLPALALLAGALLERLGPNPAEYLIRATGDWTLRWLCLTLALTPLRIELGWAGLARLRRRFGVAVYVYACLHLTCYAVFDMGLEAGAIVSDIAKRPFILMGFLAWLLLTPLAATSFDRAVRWLGGRRWRALHQLVHGVAVIAILHFVWMRSGKNDFAEPAVYAVILAVLLGWRAWRRWRRPSNA